MASCRYEIVPSDVVSEESKRKAQSNGAVEDVELTVMCSLKLLSKTAMAAILPLPMVT